MLRRLSFLLPSAVMLLAFAAPPRSFAQKTITVNGNPTPPNQVNPYKTIQSGIDAASDGDTVQVEAIVDGAYSENVSFKGKAITVVGVPFLGFQPVVQGVMGEPSFVFQSGETSKSVLSNFSILNGGEGTEPPYPGHPGPYAGLNGAIYINGASPTITNNIISYGENIYIAGTAAAPTILNNTISHLNCNSIYVNGGAPLIQGNNISATTALSNGFPICGPFDGSAIRLLNGSTATTRIIGNIIENNVQSGAYSAPGYTPTGPGGGAAISVNAPAVIQNNIIRNNNSNSAWGGGIDIEGGTISVVQNLIYGNHSDCGGGAIALPSESSNDSIAILIANNTMVDNTSGSTVTPYCAPSAQIFDANINVSEDLGANRVTIVDNIMSGATPYPDVDCAPPAPPNEIYQPVFDHNILYNANSSFFGQFCVDVTAKYGNLSADPQFTSPSTSDYTLGPTSPAVDAGNSSAIQLFQQLSGILLTNDLTGTNPRVVDATGKGYPIIDIGAYELPVATPPPPIPTTMLLSFTFPPDYHYILTATVKSPNGTPVGPVSFFADGLPLRSPQGVVLPPAEINSAGIATISGFAHNAGTRALTATYPGHDGNPSFTPAIAVVHIVAIPFIPTHLLITDNVGGRAPFGSPVTFTVTSTADDGSFPTPVPLTVTSLQTANTALLSTLHFKDSDTIAFPTVAPSPIGSYAVQVMFAGDLVYAPAGDSDIFISTGASTTTTLTCGPPQAPVGTPIPLVATVHSTDPTHGTPIGSVYFKQNLTDIGSASLASGVAQLNPNPLALPGGSSFTAIYPSQPGFESSVSNTCNVYSPALTLSSSAPSPPGAPAYSPITFTAALAGSTIPAGEYSIAIGATPPVPMHPGADGSSATYQTSTLAQGTYNVVATFTPMGSATPYTASLTQLVTAPIGDFTLTGPSNLTTPTEGIAAGTLTLTSIDNFSGAIDLACILPLPSTYTCTIAPVSATLAVNGVATATVKLAPNNLRASSTPSRNRSRIVLATLLPVTLLMLAGLRRRRRNLASLIALALMTMVTTSLTACGKDIFYAATQPGAYPLSITATGTTKGASTPATHTLNIILNITP